MEIHTQKSFWQTPKYKKQWQRIEQIIVDIVSQIPQFRYSEEPSKIIEKPQIREIKEIMYQYRGNKASIHDKTELLNDGDGAYDVMITTEDEVVFLLQMRPGLGPEIEFPAGGFDILSNADKEAKQMAEQESKDEAGASYTKGPYDLGKGSVMSGRTPQVTHFFGFEDVNLVNQSKKDLIYPFTVKIEDALLFACTILTNRTNNFFKGMCLDPKIISGLCLQGFYWLLKGEKEKVQKLYSFVE